MLGQSDHDYYGWAIRQADLLRKRDFAEIDHDGVAAEIAVVAQREREQLEAAFATLLGHMLAWDISQTHRTMDLELSIRECRIRIADILAMNRSLRRLQDEVMSRAWPRARMEAATAAGVDHRIFPEACEYSIEEVMARSFASGARAVWA